MSSEEKVLEAATMCGYTITGASLSVAIRSALKECCDENGKLNQWDLWDLTCKLERLK